MEKLDIKLHPVLNSADAGLALAAQAIDALTCNEVIAIDFERVDRMTPSFANAFVMTLLHAMSLDAIKTRVVLQNRNEDVSRAIRISVDRYNRGIRLSTQRTAIPV